jgi:hypothetical protein
MYQTEEKGTHMNRCDQGTHSSPRRTVILAILRAFSSLQVIDTVRSIRRPILFATLPGLLVAATLLPVSAASADGRIANTVGSRPSVVSAAGGLSAGRGLAVSQKEAGDVYVANEGDIANRVDQFTPAGAFVRAFGWGIVPGSAAGTGDLTKGSTAITDVTVTSGAFATGAFEGGGNPISGPGLPSGTTIERVGASELELSNPATETLTDDPLAVPDGPGNVPTNERQELFVAATGGAFKLVFNSPQPGGLTDTTSTIDYNATAAEVEAALESLSNIGPGNVSVSGGPGDEQGTHPYVVEFHGRYADTNVRPLIVTAVGLVGGSPSSEATITTSQEGGGALETCTTICGPLTVDEGAAALGRSPSGPNPGQFGNGIEAIAIDNDPSSASYGDVYVVDGSNYRVEKFGPAGEFLLMFGGEVDKTTHANVCTAADLSSGDTCGAGVPGTGAGYFHEGWTGHSSIAVGPNGTVYAGDYRRVQEFGPDGAYLGALSLPEAQFVSSLAVDSSGHVYADSLPLEGAAGELVELGPAGEVLQSFDESGEPIHIAIDEQNDLLVSEFKEPQAPLPAGAESSVDANFRIYKPSGALAAEFTSDQVENRGSEGVLDGRNPRGIAFSDPAGELFATSSFQKIGCFSCSPESYIATIELPVDGPPTVARESVTDLQTTTATLHGIVNPRGSDTHYHFDYISDQAFKADGDEFGPGTERTPSVDGPSNDLGTVNRGDPVQAPISPLDRGTLYHWRLVAESTRNGGETVDGTTETFESLPPVSVRDFTTQTVGPELVELKAELDNNNSLTAGRYSICYGTEEGHYAAGCSEGTLQGGSSAFEKVEATFAGLAPDTTYHYQLTATNSNGEVKTADQAFTTELSAAEEHAAEVTACPNVILREEDNSTALPDCRAYEQVSPPDKAGSGVFIPLLAPGGERAAFYSLGVFAGSRASETFNPYVAHRTGTGWVTQPVLGPSPDPSFQPNWLGLAHEEFDAGLDRWFFPVTQGTTQHESETARVKAYVMGSADGSFAMATPALEIVGGKIDVGWERPVAASADLSDIFIKSEKQLLESDPRPSSNNESAGEFPDRIYEVTGAGGPEPTIRLAAEVPLDLSSEPGSACGVDQMFGWQAPSASADGSVLFYDAPLDSFPNGVCEGPTGSGIQKGPNKYALFARSGESPSVQVSAPLPSQCSSPSPCAAGVTENAHFWGASPSASRAWFTTTQPLVNSDTDSTEDLYLAKLENGQVSELVQASRGEPGSGTADGNGANVQGLVALTPDALHAYFVATGVLTDTPNAQGQTAAPGADNLYAYDVEGGLTKFVARLCSGPEESGSTTDPACSSALEGGTGETRSNDSRLWDAPAPEAQVTPDGNDLLFNSYGQLTSDDTDTAEDVYRYDFQSGGLTRLSFGHNGNDGDGNDDRYGARIPPGEESGRLSYAADDNSRSIAADGSTAIFETAAPLVSRDTNLGSNPGCAGEGSSGCDIYEWEEDGHGTCVHAGGCVSLLSDGVGPHGSLRAVIGSSGRDVLIETASSLLPGDTDGLNDVYDARAEGGFPYSPPVKSCGGAESCHEAAPPAPAPPKISSGGETGGNGAVQLSCAKGRHRVTKHGQVRCVAKGHKAKKHRQKTKHKRAASADRGGKK